jgi:hypothetical protein
MSYQTTDSLVQGNYMLFFSKKISQQKSMIIITALALSLSCVGFAASDHQEGEQTEQSHKVKKKRVLKRRPCQRDLKCLLKDKDCDRDKKVEREDLGGNDKIVDKHCNIKYITKIDTKKFKKICDYQTRKKCNKERPCKKEIKEIVDVNQDDQSQQLANDCTQEQSPQKHCTKELLCDTCEIIVDHEDQTITTVVRTRRFKETTTWCEKRIVDICPEVSQECEQKQSK